jgi:hypothetical protein
VAVIKHTQSRRFRRGPQARAFVKRKKVEPPRGGSTFWELGQNVSRYWEMIEPLTTVAASDSTIINCLFWPLAMPKKFMDPPVLELEVIARVKLQSGFTMIVPVDCTCKDDPLLNRVSETVASPCPSSETMPIELYGELAVNEVPE